MKVPSKRKLNSIRNDKVEDGMLETCLQKPESDSGLLKNIGTEVNLHNRKIVKKKNMHKKVSLKGSSARFMASEKQAVIKKSGGISQQESEFLQQSAIQESDSSVSKKANREIKSMLEVPASVDDKFMKRKKRKLPSSENSDGGSDAELYGGPIAQNDDLKLSHGNNESNKKAKLHKNSVRSLETPSASIKIQTAPCAISKTKLRSVSPKKCLGFVKIPQQKIHDFEGPEDTPERQNRTVFVGNLPLSFSRKLLQRLFQNFGEIESVRLRSVVPAKPSLTKKVAVIRQEFHNKTNSFNGYVVFRNIQDVEKSLTLNKTVVQGHHIRVDRFRENIDYDTKRSVFVGNLPYDVTTDCLWSVFGECGAIEAVRVIRDPETGLGKGFGFVLFEECDSVQRALQLNETQVNGRPMRVKLVEKGNKPKVKIAMENREANLKSKKKYFHTSQHTGGHKKKTNKKLMKRRISIHKKKQITSILTQ